MFTFLIYLFVTFRTCVAPVFIHQISEKIVSTTKGRYRGLAIEFPRESALLPVHGYFGIPFASGALRFMPPSETVPIQGIINANESVSCPQIKWSEALFKSDGTPKGTQIHFWRIMQSTKRQHESCLNLNIFVPGSEWNSSSQFPVMIFVHGESYEIGTGNAYDGSVLSSFGNIIVVTVNYRLGALGFLSTGDQEAEGNYALWDLFAVVSWVNENIGAFGGDNNRVTLFGHGNGAALVNVLLLSPMVTSELVQGAILQSGSALSPWAVSFDPITCTQWLAAKVNCEQYLSNSNLLVKCFRHKNAHELVQNVIIPPKYFSCFAPTPGGGPMFPDGVRELIKEKSGIFSKIPILFGVTANEAYSYMKQKDLEEGISHERKSQMIRTFVHNLYQFHRQKLYDVIDFQYSEWNKEQNMNTTRDNVMRMLSDGLYVAPLIELAQKHAITGGESYLFNFGYSTQSEDFSQWYGGVHGDDLPYIFGSPLVDGISPFPSRFTDSEKKLSASVMRLWANFVKTGNPNMSGDENSDLNIEWPLYNLSKQNFLHIGKSSEVKHHFRGSEMALWLELIPKINSRPATGNDPESASTHMLSDSNNLSTFDDPSTLISTDTFHRILPRHSVSSNTTLREQNKDALKNLNNRKLKSRDNLRSSSEDNHMKPPTGGSENSKNTSKQITVKDSVSEDSVAIPFIVTVVVGCSLLFVNIIIYVGICYHKRRIDIMKKKYLENTIYVPENSNSEETPENRSSTTIQLNQISIRPSNSKLSIYNNPVYSAITKQPDVTSEMEDAKPSSSLCQVQICHSKMVNCDKNDILHLRPTNDEITEYK